MYFHGFPGSRVEAGLLHDAALDLDIRVLAFDRPGYGASCSLPQRAWSTASGDLRALAETLCLGRFSILAVSGGAPHALAVAASMPDRISSMALVCGLTSLQCPSSTSGMARPRQLACALLRYAPGLTPIVARFLRYRMAANPSAMIRDLATRLPSVDQAALHDEELNRLLSGSFNEALRPGSVGLASDLRFYLTAPRPDLSRLQMSLTIWHGSEDKIVPPAMSEELARQIPHARFTLLLGEGHYSLPLRHRRRILQSLVEAHRE